MLIIHKLKCPSCGNETAVNIEAPKPGHAGRGLTTCGSCKETIAVEYVVKVEVDATPGLVTWDRPVPAAPAAEPGPAPGGGQP